MLQSCPKVRNIIIAELQYSVVASGLGGGLFPYLYEEVVGWVLSPKQLPQERRSWKDDLYDYCKEGIELLFQRILQALDLKGCPVKGEGRNGAFVLARARLYQICYLTNYREGKPLACIKNHLDCARWRIPDGRLPSALICTSFIYLRLFARPKIIAIGHTSILKTLLRARPALLPFCLAT
jgi:hypothetical protein